MRRVIIKLGWYILTALGIQSIMGCERQWQQADAYGTPYATYEIKGTVIDAATKAPVKGVKVYRHNAIQDTTSSTLTPLLDADQSDSTMVDNGKFEFKWHFHGLNSEAETVFIRIKDTDPDKDGFYQEQTSQIKLEQTEGPDKQIPFHQGKFEAQNIIIEIKQAKK